MYSYIFYNSDKSMHKFYFDYTNTHITKRTTDQFDCYFCTRQRRAILLIIVM